MESWRSHFSLCSRVIPIKKKINMKVKIWPPLEKQRKTSTQNYKQETSWLEDRRSQSKIMHCFVSIVANLGMLNLMLGGKRKLNLLLLFMRKLILHLSLLTLFGEIQELFFMLLCWCKVASIVRSQEVMFRSLLNTNHFVDLVDTFFVLCFRCNLVFVFDMEKFGYTCSFE